MIEIIKAPRNVAAFRASGEVTAEDYRTVLVPAVTKLADEINEINFLFLIDTELKNFTASAWMQDVLLGLKQIGKWNRAAIVTDNENAISFTDGFSYIVPGEFRGFSKNKFDEALHWVQTGDKNETKNL